MLNLRDYQDGIIVKLRNGFARNHRAQLLYAPCGAGKTEIAVSLLDAAARKGKRAAMIVDRRILCEQTSARLEKYGIDHGIMMAGTTRWRPDELIQVCTAQTLEKREGFPRIDLLIIDEAHCQRKETSEFIRNNPNVKVIGLSGSPFTKGMGNTYTSVESAITVSELVRDGWLINPRVYIAKEIDMKGAKKVAGEWSATEATKRGIQITGDIVGEWVAKTHEIFGRPRKTIVFCAGVAHGEDLSRKFMEAGYNFISISYKDDDEYKRQVLEEFGKPGTEINGIIATDILTKGFDAADICIGISARPFSKSFSSHVQQLGRIMRPHEDKDCVVWLDHCIATGQRVLTHRGLVPIDRILLSDRIWDGVGFVTHKGVVSRGKRPVIRYAGITATPDHLVKTTDEGWCSLGYCAEKQKAVITTGIGRTALRQCDNYFTVGSLAGPAGKAIHACSLRVRYVWISLCNIFGKFAKRKDKRMPSMQSAKARPGMAECADGGDAFAMQKQEQCAMGELWWKGDRVQVRFIDFMRSLDSRELGLLGCAEGNGIRSDRQQWTLRAWEYPVDVEKSKFEQHEKIEIRRAHASVQNKAPGDSVCGYISSIIVKCGAIFRSNSRALSQTVPETEREVWDILDCGPRNSFTCEGLLVHNSGNFLRFRDQWDELYTDGVSELDDGAEKPKPEPTNKEKEAAKCPKCHALWPGNSDVCTHCGHVRVRKNDVVDVAGEMLELTGSTKKEKFSQEYKTDFYAQLLGWCEKKGYKSGSAFYKYKERFGVGPAGKKPDPKPPTTELYNWFSHLAMKRGK